MTGFLIIKYKHYFFSVLGLKSFGSNVKMTQNAIIEKATTIYAIFCNINLHPQVYMYNI